MENKYNDATPQRPKGARPLDAAFIPIKIPQYINQIKQEAAYHKNGKNAITVFKSDQVTITLIALKEGLEFNSDNEDSIVVMSLQVISGEISFEHNGSIAHIKEGELLTLHQQLSFIAKAKLPTICLLTMFK